MTASAGTAGDATVAEVLVDLLARAGVRRVFGVAGSTIMPLLDGIESDDRVDYIGARYELAAAEMASGYARAGGGLGVVMTHVGPGATSCITALAGAARDGVPLLLITGNEETETLAREPYHDWDLMGVMRALTRFSHRVTRADALPHIVRRALTEAARGATGPVHIDLPEDIALERVPAAQAEQWRADVAPVLDAFAAAPALPVSRPAPGADEVARAAELLAGAQAPLIVVGEDVRWSADPAGLIAACAASGIPFVTSFGARGGVGECDGYAGTIGRFGSRESTALLGDADVVLALGAELTDVDTTRWRVPGPSAQLIAVHHDSGKVDRRLPPTLGVVADIGEFMRALAPACAQRGLAVPEAWSARAAAVDRTAGPVGNPAAAPDAPLDARLVAGAIGAAPDSWVVSMDPGFGALSLSAPADFGGARFLYAYGLGAMGFAVPAAIGATVADGVDGALAVIGDGAFFMSLPALESVASLGAPVVVVVLDDGGFGSQRQKQQEGYGRNVGVDYDNPDIAAIAASLGVEARWVTTPEDVAQVCADLPGRDRGLVVAVRRARRQQGASWYEGSARRR